MNPKILATFKRLCKVSEFPVLVVSLIRFRFMEYFVSQVVTFSLIFLK